DREGKHGLHRTRSAPAAACSALELVGERCDQQRDRERGVECLLEPAVTGEGDEPFEHSFERIAPRASPPPPHGGIEVPPRGGGGFGGAAEELRAAAS